MKRKQVRNVILSITVPLALIALIYIFISLYYMNHFYNGTWINGVNFSHKTVDEAMDQLMEYKSSYTLRLVESNGDQELIKGSDIDYAETFDGIRQIKEEQGMWKWIFAFTSVNFYTVGSSTSYDEAKLRDVIAGLECVNSPDVTQPQNAYVEFTENGVSVVPERQGTAVDQERLFQAVKHALDSQERRVYMTDEGCYLMPEITVDSPEILEVMSVVDKIRGTVVTYTFGDATEVLDGSVTGSWLRQAEDGGITVDTGRVQAYVQGLASQYDTYGGSRQFVTTYGRTVTVGGGNYGWAIDIEAETEELTRLLLAGESTTREPVYSSTAARRGGNEIGDTYLEISISDQHMWFYKNGQLLVDTNIVTGNPNLGYDTPKGSYKVLTRYPNIVLKGKNYDGSEYESPVDYWIGFKGQGYGVHDASWRGDNQANYGGTIYIGGGSHGCVNTPLSKVKAIYDNITIGTPVLIY